MSTKKRATAEGIGTIMFIVGTYFTFWNALWPLTKHSTPLTNRETFWLLIGFGLISLGAGIYIRAQRKKGDILCLIISGGEILCAAIMFFLALSN